MKIKAVTGAIFLTLVALTQTVAAAGVEGTVMVGHTPMAGATVTLWKTGGEAMPETVREATTDKNGHFAFHVVRGRADGKIFYLTTKGGADDRLALMSVLGTELPDAVVVNEPMASILVSRIWRFFASTAISVLSSFSLIDRSCSTQALRRL